MNVDDIDLMDPATQEDWFPAYDAIRSQCPVYRIPGTEEYMLTRYDDVQYVLRHPELFPNSRTNTSFKLIQSDRAAEIYERDGFPRSIYLGANPPLQRHYRGIIDGWLARDNLGRYEGMIRSFVGELLDQWDTSGPYEFKAGFADPLPMYVIGQVLGFPAEDLPQLAEWAAAWVMPFSRGLSEEDEVYVATKGTEFQRYIVDAAHERRRNPTDDLVSHIANATFEGDDAGPRPLEDHELAGIIDHLFVGGNETTTFALTSGMWLLGGDPELQGALRADRSRIPKFIDECLRVESPTQGLWRSLAQDTELHGVTIPAGSALHLRYGAANRDPERFGCPHQVQLDRPNSGRHLAFAAGAHRCPGEWLSILEQTIVYDMVLDRFASFRCSERNTFEHLPGFVLRSLRELWLDVG